MRPEQTVSDMVEEVLNRQAEALAASTGRPFEAALEVVADTVAGRQLGELADSEYREMRAAEWQASLLWRRAEERLTRGSRATWSGWRARRLARSTTRSWRKNSLA